MAPITMAPAVRMPTPLYVPQVDARVCGAAVSNRPTAGATMRLEPRFRQRRPRDSRAAPATIGLRVKQDLPSGYTPMATRERPPRATVRHDRAALRGARRARSTPAFPWKLVAAVVVLVLVGVGVGVAYWPDRQSRPRPPSKPSRPGRRPRPRRRCAREAPDRLSSRRSRPARKRAARREAVGRNAGDPRRRRAGPPHAHVHHADRHREENRASRSGEDAHPRRAGGLRLGHRVRADYAGHLRERQGNRHEPNRGGLNALPRTPRAHVQQPGFGYSAVRTVEVEPGEKRSINIQPTGEINLNAAPLGRGLDRREENRGRDPHRPAAGAARHPRDRVQAPATRGAAP